MSALAEASFCGVCSLPFPAAEWVAVLGTALPSGAPAQHTAATWAPVPPQLEAGTHPRPVMKLSVRSFQSHQNADLTLPNTSFSSQNNKIFVALH